MSRSVSEGVELAPGVSIPRIVIGLWQLSAGHGAPERDPEERVRQLAAFVDAGLDTFDCADIYTGVEELLGRLRRSLPGRSIRVHTKFVPDRAVLPRIDRGYVVRIVDRSLRRLRAERLDLVQFHWWDFDVDGWIETAGWLQELQAAGKIRHLGVTNFDAERLRALVEAGVEVVSDQVQYSLADRRPEPRLVPFAREQGIRLLCYGTLSGGFWSRGWLDAPPPEPPFANRSLEKYALILEDAGGWSAFQRVLRAVAEVAEHRGVPIASVALRWVLERPGVAAAIVGARDDRHLEGLLGVLELELDEEDRGRLSAALDSLPGPSGPVYGMERVPGGRHAGIMHTDLNRVGEPTPPEGGSI